MPGLTVKLLKVFLASPGDVKLERDKAHDEILGLRSLAQKHGFDLQPLGWEIDVAPNAGRPQAQINSLLRDCDLFIGILWRRFGMPSGEAESGTLEEFNLARERFVKEDAPHIMLYFREVHPDFLADPGQQLQKVLEFKKQIDEGRLALYANYRDEEHFATLLRKHLTEWLLKLVDSPGAQSARAIDVHDAPPLEAFAEHLEYCRTELQKTARPLRLRTLKLPPLFLEEVEVERPRSMKVSIAAKTFPHLLILGEPGAGKTTSLKKLAAEYAQWRGEGKLPGLNEPEDFNLPIFVDLSAYPTVADKQHGLLRLITSSVRGMHDVDVRKRLAAGGCLLLFDGLNEVGEAYDEVVQQIRRLVNHEIPRNRFVVTCRPGIYRDELRNEFSTFQLERLTSFNASKVLEIEINSEKAQAAWKGLDEYTRDLCRNPLMLTLLADELRVSDTPPQNRAQLFDRFVDRYLSEWARVKGAGAVRVEKEILSALAWRLGTSRTLLSADEAAAAMSSRLAELQSKKEASSDLNVATLNRTFLEHGLLRESAGQTGFFHQAVQEYFFAREVALHQPLEFVLEHVSDPEWVEVLVFVCGLIEDATEVVQEIVKANPQLSARCTAYAKKIDGKLVDELAVVLIKRLQPRFGVHYMPKLYQDVLSLLAIESKTQNSSLLNLFYEVYVEKFQASLDYSFLLIGANLTHKAISFLEPLVAEKPNDWKLRSRFAWSLRLAERFRDSLVQEKKSTELAPEQAWTWGGLGVSYRKLGEHQQSEHCLRKALELEPRSVWVRSNLGFTLKEVGKYEEALAEFEEAIKLDQEYGWSHLGLAELYLTCTNQSEKAVVEFHIFLQLEQRPFWMSRPLFGLANALEAAGRTAEARQRYQEYLDRFPWGEHAQEAQEALERLGEA